LEKYIMKTSNLLLLGAAGLAAYYIFTKKATTTGAEAPSNAATGYTGISGYSTQNAAQAVSEKNPITSPSGVKITTPQQAMEEITRVLQQPTTTYSNGGTSLVTAQAAVRARQQSIVYNTAKIGNSRVARGASSNTSGWY
jgi:hypothetical protein